MLKRLLYRTLILLLLTFAAFGLMERLTILTGWPEVMQGMGAAAKIAWAEMTILWMRLAIAPQQDMQRLTSIIESKGASTAQAIVFAAHTLTWSLRFTAFLWLMEH